jgi:C_GCAxxG_C_C family probable redox protein
MGQLREVCGAVSGMFIIEGLLFGYTSPTDKEEKKRVYTETKSLGEDFKKENGSIICRELLAGIQHSTDGTPAERTAEYYKKRPCAEICEVASNVAEKYLKLYRE